VKTLLVYTLFALASSVVLGDTAFGCFVDLRWPELKGLPRQEVFFRMHEAGMNSACIFGYGPQDVADQMDLGLETGLFQTDVPVVVVANWSRPEDPDGSCYMLTEAKKLGKNTPCWPEMLQYGHDEAQTVSEGMVKMYEQVHKDGYRLAAGVVYPQVASRVQTLDVLLVAVTPGGELEPNRRSILAYPREYGNYYVINTIKSDDYYDLMRYYTGIWTWQTEAKYCYVWDYRRLFGMDKRWPGRKMEHGFRDGVRDWRRLQKTDWEFATSLKQWTR
jgi:hypothetical protein